MCVHTCAYLCVCPETPTCPCPAVCCIWGPQWPWLWARVPADTSNLHKCPPASGTFPGGLRSLLPLLAFLRVIAGDDSNKVSTCSRFHLCRQRGLGWVLICGCGGSVLKGWGTLRLSHVFLGVKLMGMYNKLELCCLADFFYLLFFIGKSWVEAQACLEICH